MYVCIHARCRNFYLIDTKFEVDQAKSKVEFEDELCGSIGTLWVHHKKYISITFKPQV